MEILSATQSGLITMSNENLQAIQTMLIDFEEGWNYTNIDDAMAFVRDDNNMIDFQSPRPIRIFPSKGFILPVDAKNAVSSGVIDKKDEKNCLDELRFEFTKRLLTREQVMMLDILANNDWKRSICFSSPGGSDVSMAMYRKGYIKQNGMVFELSPLNTLNDRFNSEKMYENLMKNYEYGAMNNPNVLTDYYARRHTNQYRLHFLSLAEDFVSKAFAAEEANSQREMLESMGRDVSMLPKAVDAKTIAGYKEKAKNLIHRSLEVMPAEIVIDAGEPTASNNPRDNYSVNGKTLPAFNDGILHDYVGVLYMVGDVEGAEKLGKIVADQLESIIGYFENEHVVITSNPQNTKDLYAALAAYFKLYAGANDGELGNADGVLAKRTQKQIQYVYSTMFPSILDRLKEKAKENGESTRRGRQAGRYATMMFEMEDYAEAMAIYFGIKDAPAPQQNEIPQQGPSLEDMMNPQ